MAASKPISDHYRGKRPPLLNFRHSFIMFDPNPTASLVTKSQSLIKLHSLFDQETWFQWRFIKKQNNYTKKQTNMQLDQKTRKLICLPILHVIFHKKKGSGDIKNLGNICYYSFACKTFWQVDHLAESWCLLVYCINYR